METTTPHDGPTRSEAEADRVGSGLEQVRDRMETLRADAAAFIRARPGTALILALSAGYLIGRILR